MNAVDGETKVILEHTGRYYEPVAQLLHDAGLFVSAVNPKLIKDYGNNSLRKVKTDKADSRKAARYGLANWVELRQHTPMNTIRYHRAAHLSCRSRLMQEQFERGKPGIQYSTPRRSLFLLELVYII